MAYPAGLPHCRAGLQWQGSPLGRFWFPMDAECHLLSHRSLPAAPGVFWQDTRLELLLGEPLLWLFRDLGPREQGAAPKAGKPKLVQLRDEHGTCAGAECSGTALSQTWFSIGWQ